MHRSYWKLFLHFSSFFCQAPGLQRMCEEVARFGYVPEAALKLVGVIRIYQTGKTTSKQNYLCLWYLITSELQYCNHRACTRTRDAASLHVYTSPRRKWFAGSCLRRKLREHLTIIGPAHWSICIHQSLYQLIEIYNSK
jgi:hypothetical protein